MNFAEWGRGMHATVTANYLSEKDTFQRLPRKMSPLAFMKSDVISLYV